MDVSRGGQNYFSKGGEKVVIFNFSLSKLSKQPSLPKIITGNCQVSKSRGG